MPPDSCFILTVMLGCTSPTKLHDLKISASLHLSRNAEKREMLSLLFVLAQEKDNGW